MDILILASLAPLAALFGSLLMIAPLRYFGRRKSLIAISLPALAGFILMGYTRYIRHKEALYVGRIITGLMNGASIPASQIYVRSFYWPNVSFRVDLNFRSTLD